MAEQTIQTRVLKTIRRTVKLIRQRLDAIDETQADQGAALARVEQKLGTLPGQARGWLTSFTEGITGPTTIASQLDAILKRLPSHEGASASATGTMVKLDGLDDKLSAMRSDVGTLRSESRETLDYLRFGYTRNSKTLETLAEAITPSGEEGISQSSSQLRPAFAQLRDLNQTTYDAVIDVSAELDASLSAKLDGHAFSIQDRQDRHFHALRQNDDVVRGRVEHGITLTADLARLLEGVPSALAQLLNRQERVAARDADALAQAVRNLRADYAAFSERQDKIAEALTFISSHLSTIERKVDTQTLAHNASEDGETYAITDMRD